MSKVKTGNNLPKSSVMQMPASLKESQVKIHLKSGGKGAKVMAGKDPYKKTV